MDMKHTALDTDDGPDNRKRSHPPSESGDGDGPDAKKSSPSVTVEKKQDLELEQEQEGQGHKEKVPPGDGNQLSPNTHVPAFTGNGCSPSLESFMFQQTPAGSQLCSWVNKSASQTSTISHEATSVSDFGSLARKSKTKFARREHNLLRRESTLKALALERELISKSGGLGYQHVSLLLRFPDPEITLPQISAYSKGIQEVSLTNGLEPRSCLLHLKPEANVEQTIQELNHTAFGSGHLRAEVKSISDEEQAELIDPCSLYVSNIPFNMTTASIKAYFVHSMRVDIGVQRREKRARYAFVRYASPEMAADAFRNLLGSPLNSRVLTVRYRRLKRRLSPPRKRCSPKCNSSNLTLNAVGTDDEVTELDQDCKVISPPPVESITISDSDDTEQFSLTPCKEEESKDSKLLKQGREIEILKRQMAELMALQKLREKDKDKDEISTKLELVSEPVNLASLEQDIKVERAYLGLPLEHTPAYMPTTQPLVSAGVLEADPANKRCLGRRKSRLPSKTPEDLNEQARWQELQAQLEAEFDT